MSESDHLVRLLDAQIDHLQKKLSVMRRMADCVRHGDADALDELLEQQTQLEAGADSLERQITLVRQQIAGGLGVPADQVTLGRLVESLAGPAAMALSDRRERLLMMVQQVQESADALKRLVRHAMGFSDQLLAAVAGAEHDSATYSPRGAAERNSALSTFRHSV